MALLKKIRGSSLVEILVASALIMIVFVIATLTLNNVFKGVVASNDTNLTNRLSELKYLSNHNALEIPHFEENANWDIAIELTENRLKITSLHKPSNRETIQYLDALE